MRVLIASTAGSGHLGPLLPFVDAFVRRGDEPLLVVPPGLAERVAALGRPYRLGARPPEAETAEIRRRFDTADPRERSVLIDRELFGRLQTAAMLPAMTEACRAWRPDLVLREPCEYASAVAAERHGIRHAQVAISQAHVEMSAVDVAAPALLEHEPELPARLRAAPYLTRFPAELDPSAFPATYRFREPDPEGRPLPDWWAGSAAPLVYITFGTVTGGLADATAVYRAAVDAVAGLPVRALLTVGTAFDAAVLDPLPPNVRVRPWVPQADVLTDAAVVVCHGGSGTVLGTVAAGVPLVVAPMFADHAANARLVDAAGAGVMVRRADAGSIADAVTTVLTEPGYRAAAGRLAARMGSAPSVDELLDDLVHARQSTEVNRAV